MDFRSVLKIGCALVLGSSVPSLASDVAEPGVPNELNLFAGTATFYEAQVRTANSCRTDDGSPQQKEACRRKIAPKFPYRAHGGDRTQCGIIDDLDQIKLGTLDDMMEPTHDYHDGITLRYIQENVGANVVWLMPLFPNNMKDSIPDSCDNLGSPYAVRDYLHVSGSLSRSCISKGKGDDREDATCWASSSDLRPGYSTFDQYIDQAHQRGLKVILDVALNHFGHNYRYYDYLRGTSISDRIARNESLDGLWNYESTYDSSLVNPEILDQVDQLKQLATRDPAAQAQLNSLFQHCPTLERNYHSEMSEGEGDQLVRQFGMWRNMMDWEKARFVCNDPAYLEYSVPGFYVGSGGAHPSSGVGDNFTNNWMDVKFLFHHEMGRNGNQPPIYYPEFVRTREYMFRILNYWASRGVDGFRLDHSTDDDSGMTPNEWKYILGKVDYYNWVRKGRRNLSNSERQIFLAEEFENQVGMSYVVDVMTEGYLGDLRGRAGAVKNASFVESQLEKANRFQNRVYVLRTLETHDEPRLMENTGFDAWTGAGFWGIGAASRGTAMLLMGQEFGESWGLGFRRSDYLRGRFYGNANHRDDGAALSEFYRSMSVARRDSRNSAMVSQNVWYLRTRSNTVDERVFAQAKWDDQTGNVVFTFNNLWPVGDIHQSYYLPPDLAGKLMIDAGREYQFRDILSGERTGGCFRGSELEWDFKLDLPGHERLRWLRLEECS